MAPSMKKFFIAPGFVGGCAQVLRGFRAWISRETASTADDAIARRGILQSFLLALSVRLVRNQKIRLCLQDEYHSLAALGRGPSAR